MINIWKFTDRYNKKEASRMLFLLKRTVGEDVYKRKNVLRFISKFILRKSPKFCKLVRVLQGHEHSVNCLIQVNNNCKDPSETVLISGGKDKRIRVWKNFECERVIEAHADSVRCLSQVRWKRNNHTVISGSSDESIKVWNVLTGECIHTIEDPGNQINCIRQIHISNKIGNDMIFAIAGNITTVQIFFFTEINYLKVIKKLHGHSDIVFTIVNVTYKNMNTIATGSRDSTVKIWNMDKFDCILSYYVKWPVYSIFPIDRELITLDNSMDEDNYELKFAIAGLDKNVTIWDFKNSRTIGLIKGHNQSISSVIPLYVRNKKYLASCGFDKTIKIWKLE